MCVFSACCVVEFVERMGSEEAAAESSGPSAILKLAQEWKGMGDSMVKSLVDCFSSIESRERNLRLGSESLAKRSRDLDERERKLEELNNLLERRSEELSLREETLDEQLKLVGEHIEGLEISQCEVEGLKRKENEKLKEIEKRERELDNARGLLERRLDEVGKKLNEFDAFQNGKLEELASKEKVLCEEKREFVGKLEELASKEKLFRKEKREFIEEVKLANEKLKEKQRLGYDLIKRLESAIDMLGGMKVIMDEKLKEIESRETMAHESLTSRLNEADSILESLEKRFKELEDIEKELDFSQDKTRKLVSKEQILVTKREQSEQHDQMVENEPEELTQELELKQGILVSGKKEHKYEKLDHQEKNMSSGTESLQTHAKENLASSKKDRPQRQTVGTQDEVYRLREVESERELHGDYFKERGSKQSMLTDGQIVNKPDESVNLGHELQKDRKALEMLITEKDLEMMDGEIYKILSRSSDPANVVLETLQGFHALHPVKLDTECKVRTFTILLLEQLTKISPKIQNCVTAAAVKLASEWKSKLIVNAENTMEVLGFLHFVAAFHLSSRFDKNELFNFLKLVGQHKGTPELCLSLGLTWKIPGYIQHLINRKEYLLASTYTHEYQFMNLSFKQAAILNFYVAYSKKSANTRARKEGNTFEARDKAIDSEIADLQTAFVHIIKYGLQSDYPPNALTARIQQLEAGRASLRHGCPSSSAAPADMQKLGNSKKSGYPNKWKKRRKYRQFAPDPNPCDGSNSWSAPPDWTAQHQLCNTETHPAVSPAVFLYPCTFANGGPMPNPGPDRPFKRRKSNTWHRQFGKQH